MTRYPLHSLLFFMVLLLAHTSVPAAFDSATFNKADKPLEVVNVKPSGEDVYAGREIVFQFNQPVVPVGRMERTAAEIPVQITPALDCQWRWLNTSALSCQLSDSTRLKLATHYQIQMQPGITTEDGKTLVKPLEHGFTTQYPKVSYQSFDTWTAPGKPQIRVSFNQRVQRASVTQALYFLIGERRYPVQVIADKEAQAEDDPDAEYNPEETEAEQAPAAAKSSDFRNAWIIEPLNLLPEDAEVSLNVQPGLVAEEGAEKGVENRLLVNFASFPEFRLLGIKCTNNDEQSVSYLPSLAPVPALNKRCNPLRSVGLEFSSPVPVDILKDHLKLAPDLAGGRKDYDPWERLYRADLLDQPHQRGNTYTVWLPEYLRAWQNYQLFMPTKIEDAFGRRLPLPVQMRFATNHRLPDYSFEHNTAVLESGVDSQVPIVVTNLERLNLNYHLLTASSVQNNLFGNQPLAKVIDIAYRTPLDIRALIPGASGVVQGTFSTTPEVRRDWSDYWFFTQVTPFHVEAKAGYHNTLVWMTDFATGQPVADANVQVYKGVYGEFPAQPEVLASARTNADGIAILPGLSALDPDLRLQTYNRDDPRLFLYANKQEAIALMALDENFAVDMYSLSDDYSVYGYSRKKYGHIHTWGTTAQGVYKVGDTVQFKLLVRDQSNTAFSAPPREGYKLTVTDPMGKSVYEVENLTLSEFGGYAGEFSLADSAAVGWYNFELTASFTEDSWQPLRVLVSDFTPSPFRVRNSLNGELFKANDTLKIETTANLHAGGPYADAPSALNVLLDWQTLPVAEPALKGFYFDTCLSEDSYDCSSTSSLHSVEGQVDKQGVWHSEFVLTDMSPVVYGKLMVESTVRDDRGKDVASRTSAQYLARDRFVGLRQTTWVLAEDEPATVNLIVVDEHGKPAAGTDIHTRIEYRATKAARVKGAGNAYLTQYTHEWEERAQCDNSSTAAPLDCQFTPADPGLYRLTAQIKDTQGREHFSRIDQWVSGKGQVVWEMADNNGLDVQPEATNYKVGDKARFLVKNPYPGSKALITVERFGVMDHWVETFDESLKILEIPIKSDYLPGFYLSVMVMSPRVDKPIENQVDLGKPAFRMGYVKIAVEDPYKELQVTVKPQKEVYRPRDKVTVDLQATARYAELKSQPVEIAVAVLDESVFDLIAQGRSYFDPYTGFYSLDELDVKNFNLLLKLVGRQKFEKKGANPGGDGAASNLSMRSLFKFVSYWNPSVKTDAEGKAQIQFDAPDNLTGWRVLAMAVTPEDLMGLGDANFKVNQPIELRPVLPNQLTVGDQVQVGFSVMNRTDKPQKIAVHINALQNSGDRQETVETLDAPPYERKTVWLPLTAQIDGQIQLTARAEGEDFSDALQQSLTVYKRRSLNTSATYGTTVLPQVTERIAFPADIHADSGGISLTTAPSIIANVDGAFEYMRDYPYACWEQKLSKGVMASHYNNLRAWLPDSLIWKEADQLPLNTLQLAAEYQAPNGGMAFYVPQNERVSPYLSAYTALAFSWLRDSGLAVPEKVENHLHEYLNELLRKDLLPDFYTKGMASSVRAVALAALSKQGKVTLADIQRYQPHVPEMSLFGKAQFLTAAINVKGTEKIRQQVVDKILAQSVESGGKITFNEVLDDSYTRILATPLRDNCAVLSSLTQFEESGQTVSSGLPFKLVRSIIAARKSRTYWENTQENMFCMNALIDYARVYENVAPDMQVKVWFTPDGATTAEALGETKFSDVRNPPVVFKRDMTSTDPGKSASIKLEKQGDGRLYYGLHMKYAPKLDNAEAINAGMVIKREYHVERNGTWQLLDLSGKTPQSLKTGELVRVDLYLSLPTARNFVVVDDPVPGGLEPVNRDLATSSQVAADKAKSDYAGGSLWFDHSDWQEYGFSFWSFYHTELRHHAAIFYSDYLPAGNYHLSYVAQAIAPGKFSIMPTHAEEMYEPDVYGKGLPGVLEVVR